MSKGGKIKILAAAAALSVSGASCRAENDNNDMEKQSLIEKLKGLVGKGAKTVMPEMAMCYDMPAQPSDEFTCPKCGDSFYLWHNQYEQVQDIVNALKTKGHDVSVDRICKKCAGIIEREAENNEVIYVFTYKAPDAKKPHTAYTDDLEDFYVVKAALNGADTYFYFKEIKLSDKTDVIKKMLGK